MAHPIPFDDRGLLSAFLPCPTAAKNDSYRVVIDKAAVCVECASRELLSVTLLFAARGWFREGLKAALFRQFRTVRTLSTTVRSSAIAAGDVTKRNRLL
jgi:hypothetical protein